MFVIRFGDSELGLSKCEVMLKDVHDSLRIGTHLQNDPSYGIQNLVSFFLTIFELL